MKNMMNKLTKKINRMMGNAKLALLALVSWMSLLPFRAKAAVANARGEGFVDTAIKILMAVVIGALVLAGLYLLFDKTVLPTLTQRVKDMFNYAG